MEYMKMEDANQKKDKEKIETAIDDTMSYRSCPSWKKTCKR